MTCGDSCYHFTQLCRVYHRDGNILITLYHQHTWSWCWCTYWYAYIVFNMCGDGASVHGSARRFTAHWPRVTVTSAHGWRPSPLFFIPDRTQGSSHHCAPVHDPGMMYLFFVIELAASVASVMYPPMSISRQWLILFQWQLVLLIDLIEDYLCL